MSPKLLKNPGNILKENIITAYAVLMKRSVGTKVSISGCSVLITSDFEIYFFMDFLLDRYCKTQWILSSILEWSIFVGPIVVWIYVLASHV